MPGLVRRWTCPGSWPRLLLSVVRASQVAADTIEWEGRTFETYADIGLDEWITMRVHVAGEKAELYLNDAKYPSFIVNKMKGTSKSGKIGMYFD
jgi:hypothetical protein